MFSYVRWNEDVDAVYRYTSTLPLALLFHAIVVNVLVGEWVDWLVRCVYLGASYVFMCVCLFARPNQSFTNPPPPPPMQCFLCIMACHGPNSMIGTTTTAAPVMHLSRTSSAPLLYTCCSCKSRG